MKRESSLALVLIIQLFTVTFGQQPTPTPLPAPQQQDKQADDDVVRISTNLVQIDALVTDKKGRQVTDLRPEEFEVLEDGRPQKITNFSYIALDPAGAPMPAASTANKNGPPVPPVRLRPEQVRRTIALVVDDLSISFESAHATRRGLRKFVDEQMQPGDLVAILRTTAGVGALQQFTSDKRQLHLAIERVRGSLTPRGASAFGPLSQLDPVSVRRPELEARDSLGGANDLDEFREELFAIGTLGSLNYVVRGLREMPGRKAVVLISSNLPIFGRHGRNDRLLEALRRLADLSNRAAVVIYTMDPRGLQPFGFTAADDTSNFSVDQFERALSDRSRSYFESQNGLNYLAKQTGGIFIHDTNDLTGGFQRILEDQKGYYLIGYRPHESTFDPATGGRRFHKISVKVNRPGIRIRSRSGFYGVTDEQAHPVRRTREEQLLGALVSPFGAGDIDLRLTSLFGNDPRAGSFVRSLIHVDARDLSFTKESDGSHKANMDVVAITFGDNGLAIDQVDRIYSITLNDADYQRVQQSGFIYALNVPIKKAGAYQLRVAVRDAAQQRVGSASQFIEIPNLDKKRLALSGIILGGVDAVAATKKMPASEATAAATVPPAATSQGASKAEGTNIYDPQSGPAVRRFSQGMSLDFAYVIYNAQLDRATNRPNLLTQIRLFRDGQEVFAGKELPFNVENQADLTRLIAGGRLRLVASLVPGEYTLQVIVKDTLAKEKHQMASQWMDFEIK